jgi:hypothetical protein
MAITTTNLLLLGLHGKLGNQVIFRSWAGRTVMSNVHDYSNAVWSPAQRQIRWDFGMAVRWAKVALKDEKTYRHYKKRRKGAQTAYNVAIGEYIRQQRQEADARQTFIPGGKVFRYGINSSYFSPPARPGIMGSDGRLNGSISGSTREVPVATGFQ